MDNRRIYLIVTLILLSLSGCGVKNWFVAKNNIETAVNMGLPNDSIQEIAENHHPEQQDTLLFLEDTLVLQDSTLLMDSVQTTPLVDSLLAYAKQFLGKRYHMGGNGPDSFDCSGFTSFVYRHFGFKLNRSSDTQMANGTPVKVQADLHPGDLVFYAGRKLSNHIGHVGIVVENDPKSNTFTFIHAACQGGVIISKSDEPYYAQRYISACRVLGEKSE